MKSARGCTELPKAMAMAGERSKSNNAVRQVSHFLISTTGACSAARMRSKKLRTELYCSTGIVVARCPSLPLKIFRPRFALHLTSITGGPLAVSLLPNGCDQRAIPIDARFNLSIEQVRFRWRYRHFHQRINFFRVDQGQAALQVRRQISNRCC